MSEMIERVARALYARDKMRKDATERAMNGPGGGPWVSVLLPYESQNLVYRDLAQAAIEAMREPTEGMTKAGHDEAPFCELGVPLARPCLVMTAASYQAMIDTALKS